MSLLARLRRVRAEALGLNRRNLELLQPYNRGPLYAVVDHKQRTKEALERVGLPVPETYAVCSRPRDLNEFGDTMEELTDFVLKPARGAGGEGIVVIAGRDDGAFCSPSGRRLGRKDLVAHASDILSGAYAISQAHDEALLEYRLRSAPEVEPISPGGVADIRIVVFRGVPIMAMLRLPTRASGGRANLHSGGIGVGIAIASGLTGHAIQRGRAIDRHPDTGVALRDWPVPSWERMLQLAAEAHRAVPLGYFGIDVVLDATRGPVILEMNARPGLAIQLATQKGLRPVVGRIAVLEKVEECSPEERVGIGIRLGA
jgi:alpha-L-glutamate ligase-like protein